MNDGLEEHLMLQHFVRYAMRKDRASWNFGRSKAWLIDADSCTSTLSVEIYE